MKKMNKIVGDSLYQITEKYFDDVVNTKVRKAVNSVVNKSNLKIFQNLESFNLIKENLIKKKNDLDLDPSVTEPVQQGTVNESTRPLQIKPKNARNQPQSSQTLKKKSNLIKKVKNEDLELTKSQKVDILISKVQDFQDLVVDIGEDYFGQLGEFSKDYLQRKMVKLGFEFLNLNP